MNSKKISWIKWLLLIIIVGACAFFVLGYVAEPEPSEEHLFASVKVGKIENSIVATGQLEPKQYVEVGAQVSGQVDAILVEEGAQVEKGQLLVEIDATVFKTQVQTSEAALESKKAQLAQLEAEYSLSVLRAKRNAELYKQNAVSEDVVYESKTNVKVLESRIRASVAGIKADEASLEGDKATLGFARIFAPISGTVASIAVRKGQTLNANQSAPTLLQISDLQLMTIRAEVSEAQVGKLYKGMPVYFATLGDNKTFYHSTVRQVLPTPTVINDVVLYQVLIDVENSSGKLMDSMTTQVFFVQDIREDTKVVPIAAVKGRGSKKFVMLRQGTDLVRQLVKTGISNRTMIEITDGLSEGDEVVIGSKADDANSAPRDAGGRNRIPGGSGRRGGF